MCLWMARVTAAAGGCSVQDNAWHRGKPMMDPIQQEPREEQMQCWTEVGQGGNRAQELGGPSLYA